MTTELLMLAWSGALSLLLALVVIAVHFRAFGGTIGSNREDYPPLAGVAGRVGRAHANLNEALLPFAIAVVCALAVHVTTRWTALAAEVFLGARVAHAGLYIAGVPEIRSLAYYIGLLATMVIMVPLLA